MNYRAGMPVVCRKNENITMKLIAKSLSTIALALSFSTSGVSAENYQPNWQSLDSRPVAPWFRDAKLGIFIHWGPYSVPAWSPKGTYAEWYQHWLQGKGLFGNGDFKGDEVYQYHVKTYGEDYDYYNFASQLTGDLFDPQEWVELFEKAGARYVVLTSKHHDGFALWPNQHTSDTRGFAWNSVETGPKRDIVGELSKAVKGSEKIKMGLYYSFYEWYHPLWLSDKQSYVDDYMLPQFKELVQQYEPDLLWPDGEWDLKPEQWRSQEFLTWLFNESRVKDKVVVSDRWGDGTKFKHGGYFTPEYGRLKDADYNQDKPWEESRGIGFSFGYNQNEDAEDYNSPRTLVLMLTDIVSRGGNLLLDIGPDERGKIPPIMQQRLLELGKWLEVNGEAIYGTNKWHTPIQWSEGDRTLDRGGQHYLGGDYILKQTLSVAEGKATKELFYTAKGNDVFVIAPIYPKQQLQIKHIKPSENTTITLLGHNKPLAYQYKNNRLLVTVPPLTYDELPSHHAWAFKVTNAK